MPGLPDAMQTWREPWLSHPVIRGVLVGIIDYFYGLFRRRQPRGRGRKPDRNGNRAGRAAMFITFVPARLRKFSVVGRSARAGAGAEHSLGAIRSSWVGARFIPKVFNKTRVAKLFGESWQPAPRSVMPMRSSKLNFSLPPTHCPHVFDHWQDYNHRPTAVG